VDGQHGLDAALVMQDQPTQALLRCRDNHPLDAASRRLTAASLVEDLTNGSPTSLQRDERRQMLLDQQVNLRRGLDGPLREENPGLRPSLPGDRHGMVRSRR